MNVGSLCSGYGGLDLAVGGDLVWQSEIDAAASTVLEVRFPDVPNVGDFRTADLEPVGVVCAGFPCQPVSTAGRQAGVDDERWLFDDIADAVGRMDPLPRLLVFENVPGLLSANGGDAMARVVHRLGALGYMGRWRCLAASDIGACHRRNRWWGLATHADHVRCEGDGPFASEHHRRSDPGPLLPTPTSTYPGGTLDNYRQRLADHDGRVSRAVPLNMLAEQLLPTPRWAEYAAAITRHETLVGRPTPDPTDHRGRLSPRFVEWMMCLPDGWVTDLDLPRTAQLRVLGNGVVPPQAAAAIGSLS